MQATTDTWLVPQIAALAPLETEPSPPAHEHSHHRDEKEVRQRPASA